MPRIKEYSYHIFFESYLIESCVNIDGRNGDMHWNHCRDYKPSWCGKYDDNYFNSSQLCCACGGGKGRKYIILNQTGSFDKRFINEVKYFYYLISQQ